MAKKDLSTLLGILTLIAVVVKVASIANGGKGRACVCSRTSGLCVCLERS